MPNAQGGPVFETEVGASVFTKGYPLSTIMYQGKKVVLRPLKQPLFDCETYPNAAIAGRRYFTRPQGTSDATGAGGIANKAISETNLTQNGQLSAPDTFALFGFNFVIQYGTTLGDMRTIFNTGAFEFTFTGNRVYLEVPLNRIPSGLHPEGPLCCDGATAAVVWTEVQNGVGHISNVYPFNIKDRTLWIQPNENFGVQTLYPQANITVGALTRTWVFLVGMLYKAI